MICVMGSGEFSRKPDEKLGGNLTMNRHRIQVRVVILLATSCYGNRDQLQLDAHFFNIKTRFLPYQTKYFSFVVILIHHFRIQLDICFFVQSMMFEINILHKASHIKSFGSKVISTRNVRDDAFTTFDDGRQPHPHIPVS